MNTQKIFLITLFLALFASCAPKKAETGGGGGTPVIRETDKCLDADASNRGSLLPCICEGEFVVNSFGTACNRTSGTTTGTGGGGGLAPNALFYANNPWTMLVGVLTTPQGPSVANCGSPNTCTFSVVGSTPLPSGLSINPNTGVISGIPNSVGNRVVKIRATSSLGSTDNVLNIRVIYPAPSGLTVNNLASGGFYAVGNILPTISFTYSSAVGSVDTMSISPSLPSGLSFSIIDATNKIWGINGTFTETSTVREYTVQACGTTFPCTSVKFNLGAGQAPANFSYNVAGHPNCSVGADNIPSCVFTKLSSFPDILATVSGDALSFQILSGGQGSIPANELPSGIALKGTDGSIYGTSFGSFENTNQCNLGGPGTCLYTVRAFNFLGSVTTQIKIKIVDGNPPTAFSYPGSPFVFRNLTLIPDINPEWENGSLPSCHAQSGCYSISPTLPPGMGISPLTGRINGTPNLNSITPPTVYTITANNIQGGIAAPISTTVSIEVKQRLPVFSYNNNGDYIFFKGASLNEMGSPSILQDPDFLCGQNAIPITSFSISPTLPSGLSLRTEAFECGIAPELTGGSIIGVPTNISPLQNYTITGCNSGGCSSVVIKIEIPQTIDKIVTGEKHACAIAKDGPLDPGQVVCWGDNSKGQLGFNATDICEGQSCSLTAKKVRTDSNSILTNVLDLSVGKNHTCAIIGLPPAEGQPKQGILRCWGDNSAGQLMAGIAGSFSQVPLTVSGKSMVTAVALGGDQSCFAGEHSATYFEEPAPVRGHVFCSNVVSSGNAGYTRKENILDPETGSGENLFYVRDIVAGNNFFCATAEDLASFDGDTSNDSGEDLSKTKCWGQNDKGQLGRGPLVGDDIPRDVIFSASENGTGSPETGVFNLTAGGSHACYSKEISGSVRTRCWGDNTYGQLGRSSLPQSNVAISLLNESGSLFLDALRVGATAKASFVTQGDPAQLFTAGAFVLPGFPYIGIESSFLTPIKNNLGNNLEVSPEIAPSGAFSENFACAKSSKGEIICWGNNSFGQLGNNSLGESILPQKVIISN